MKNLFLTSILLLISSVVLAQNTIQKGDITIQVVGDDPWGDHPFLMDIVQKGNSVKIKYAYCDSINSSDVGKDPQYLDINKRLYRYKSSDPKEKLAWDTVGKIFERHRVYTLSSTSINLKTDTAYSTLVQRVGRVKKQEFMPKVRSRANEPFIIHSDGFEVTLTIITSTDKVMMPAYPPLLAGFIKQTLDKKRNSKAVKKILKYYAQYQ
jgi:hypothetical protein